MTGLSRAQITRLITRFTATCRSRPKVTRRRRFSGLHTRADLELLTTVDKAHETLSGPTTWRILECEHLIYMPGECTQLAASSLAHLYNLRRSQRYRERRLNDARARDTTIAIGERSVPQPEDQPGYLRPEKVNQGNPPDAKGVYHTNTVEEDLQWQVVGSALRISHAHCESRR